MSQAKVLTEAFRQPLKVAGFKKAKSDTWIRRNPDTVSVLNVQKSNYGHQYYINVALWLNALGDVESPPEHSCPIRFRWELLIPQDCVSQKTLLDLEDTSMTDPERTMHIASILERYVLPFFSQTATLDGLRTTYRAKPWLKSHTIAKARPLLEEGFA